MCEEGVGKLAGEFSKFTTHEIYFITKLAKFLGIFDCSTVCTAMSAVAYLNA